MKQSLHSLIALQELLTMTMLKARQCLPAIRPPMRELGERIWYGIAARETVLAELMAAAEPAASVIAAHIGPLQPAPPSEPSEDSAETAPDAGFPGTTLTPTEVPSLFAPGVMPLRLQPVPWGPQDPDPVNRPSEQQTRLLAQHISQWTPYPAEQIDPRLLDSNASDVPWMIRRRCTE